MSRSEIETFRKTFTGWRISSDGYRVKGMSRSVVRYEDDHLEIDVAAEMLVGPEAGYIVYVDSVPVGSRVSRAEIADRMTRALGMDGSKVEIVGDLDPHKHS